LNFNSCNLRQENVHYIIFGKAFETTKKYHRIIGGIFFCCAEIRIKYALNFFSARFFWGGGILSWFGKFPEGENGVIQRNAWSQYIRDTYFSTLKVNNTRITEKETASFLKHEFLLNKKRRTCICMTQ